MWSINDRPSLRFVTDAIRLNRSADIVLELSREKIISDDTGAIMEDTSSTLLQSMEGAELVIRVLCERSWTISAQLLLLPSFSML